MTYKEQLESPLWQKKRLKIFERDEFSCQLCCDNKTQLHVHHLSYSGNAWEALDDELITLCKYCHLSVEYLKKKEGSLRIYHVIKKEISGKDGDMLICFCENSKTHTKDLVMITIIDNKIVDGLQIFNETLLIIFNKLGIENNGKQVL
jgi:hypothetical protein